MDDMADLYEDGDYGDYGEEEYGYEYDPEDDLDFDFDLALAEKFESLLTQYPRSPALEGMELPVSVGEIRAIYDSIVKDYGGVTHRFQGADSDAATIEDLQTLFRKILENYEQESMDLHLNHSQMEALQRLFNNLAGHYS